MYSLTRRWIGSQLAMMQIGISAVVEITNGSEMPSTPEVIGDGAAEPRPLFDELKLGDAGSKRQTRISEIANVISVVHNAIQRALRLSASPRSRISMMNSAPASGRKRRDGEDRPAHITDPPANMNQVISAATPISMAKA